MSKKLIGVCAPLILTLVMAILCLVAYNAEKEFFTTYKTWVTTEAYVDEVNHEGVRKKNRRVEVDYTYVVDGKTYTGHDSDSSMFRNASSVEEGTLQTIWYNPNDPSQSSYWKPNPLAELELPLFMGGVGIVLAVRNLFKKKDDDDDD